MKRYLIYNASVMWGLVSLIIVLWTSASLLLAVKQRPKPGNKAVPKADIKAVIANTVIASNSEFAFDLYAKLKDDPNAQKPDGNLFFSPYSISTALAMTYAGAGTRGQTQEQMERVLHFYYPLQRIHCAMLQQRLHEALGLLQNQLNKDKEVGYELNVANALWGQKGEGFLPEFLELTKKYYGAGPREVDFVRQTEKARKTINAWVEKQTKDKIKELIKKGILGRDTVLVLTNAIYFKGDWAIQFDREKTKDAPFMISADKKVNVPMMYLKENFKYWADKDLQVIELPYKGEHLSMIVLLPREVDSLSELEKKLTLENLNSWLQKLRKQEVMVYLPRFKMTWGVFELNGILKDMGMKDAFSGKADFSAMTGRRDLFISNVLHKAFVEVNEEGTEAVAATAVIMERIAMSIEPVFRADHPFVFIIKDNRSGSILFMGRVSNPKETG